MGIILKFVFFACAVHCVTAVDTFLPYNGDKYSGFLKKSAKIINFF
jgi:hypothetical protein